MKNVQRDIRDNFAMKRWRMNMVIRSIDDDNSLMEKSAKSNANVYGSIIGGSFHTVPFFPNILTLILMLKFARALVHSNIYSNMYSRVGIERLQSWKMKSMKLKIMLMHVTYRHLRRSGVFLASNCIIVLQRFSVDKFILSISRLSHSMMIQISLHFYKMIAFARLL